MLPGLLESVLSHVHWKPCEVVKVNSPVRIFVDEVPALVLNKTP